MIRPADHPVHLVLGLAIWGIGFVALYGGLSVGCAIAPPTAQSGAMNWLNAVMACITVALFAWLLVQALQCWRSARRAPADATRTRFVSLVSAGLYVASAVSTLVIGLPVIALPPCL